MTVEIKSVEIGTENIIIGALAIEDIILAEDLFEDAEVREVTYNFSRTERNGAALKYLWKLCQGQRRCQSEKSTCGH